MKNKKLLSLLLTLLLTISLFTQFNTNICANQLTTITSVTTELEVGNIYSDFKLTKSQPIPDTDSICNIFTHQKTGATLVYIKNNDQNKAFSISFKTPASNDKGIPHIIEHSVLAGSKNFPSKHTFEALAYKSLGSFVNAFTSDVFTTYPVASKNNYEFVNMMKIYTDAVFNPNLLKDINIFKREGIRKEITDKNKSFNYNGIVYNEMKGYSFTKENALNTAINKNLLLKTPFSYNSGGEPKDIEDLTYAEVINYYNQYYHPSNAFFYFYGKMDILDKLEFLNDNYLSKYSKKTIATNITKISSLKQRAYVQTKYPANDNNTENNACISLAFNAGNYTDLNSSIGLELLAQYLNSEQSPLRKALETADLSTNYTVSVNGTYHKIFVITLENADITQSSEFENLVTNTFKDLALNKVNRTAINAIFEQFQLGYTDSKNMSENWYDTYSTLLPNWAYGTDLLFCIDLDIPSYFDNLKTEVSRGLLENIIKKYLINNINSVLTTMVPSKELQQQNEENTISKLDTFKKSLTQSQLNNLIKETNDFNTWVNAPESVNIISTIPLLSINDVKKDIEDKDFNQIDIFKSTTDTVNDIEIVHTEESTNDVVYTNMYFDSFRIPQEDIEYAQLLLNILGKINTENYSIEELETNMTLYGDIYIDSQLFKNVNNQKEIYPKTTVSLMNNVANTSKLLNVTNDIIYNSKFDDVDRLGNLIADIKLATYENLSSNGYIVFDKILNNLGNYGSTTDIEFYKFISKVEKEFIANPNSIITKLNSVYNLMFPKQDLIVGITCSSDNYTQLKEPLKSFFTNLKQVTTSKQKYEFKTNLVNEAYIGNMPVQYTAKGINYSNNGYSFSGKIDVLNQLVNEYLLQKIRIEGNAYGACMFYDLDNITFASWQDPKLQETLDAFNNAGKFISSMPITDELLDSYKVPALRPYYNYDYTYAPSKGQYCEQKFIEKGVIDLNKIVKDIISTTPQDIKNLAPILDELANKGIHCVIGNESKINENKDLFDSVDNLIE